MATCERKSLVFFFTSQVTVHHRGKSKKEHKAGTLRQVVKQKPWNSAAYYRAPNSLLNLLFYAFQNHLTSCSSAQSGLGSPISIINQENFLQPCLQEIWWRCFLSCVFPSQITPAYVKLTDTKQKPTKTIYKAILL